MTRLVLVGVVRVGGVGHVGRAAHRAGQRAEVLVPPAAEAQHDPLGDRGQQRGRGATVGRGADLLVVEEHEHRDRPGGRGVVRRDRRAAPRARPSSSTGCRAAAADTSSSDSADQRARGGVVEHEVPPEDGRRRHVELLGDEGRERPRGDVAQAPHRAEVLLGVQQQPVGGDLPVEVDGELRHPEQRPVDEEEPLGRAVAVAHHHPTGEPEVAVEPRVEEGAAVHLDGQLPVAGPAGVGVGLHPEVGAVGVGADDAERRAGRLPGLRGPRHQAPAPAHVVPAGSGRPGVGLGQVGRTRQPRGARRPVRRRGTATARRR